MIFDRIENAKNYLGLNKGVDMLLRKMMEIDPQSYVPRREELDGKNVYAVGKCYCTKQPEDAKMEAHRKYIDVMYMLEGSETIYVKDAQKLDNITQPYDADKDVILAQPDVNATAINLEAGSFVILFPQDAHAPGCCQTAPSQVTKVIGKASVEA